MIITISGNPGSGKSTIANSLVNELGYKRVYAGQIMRDIAKRRGITLQELGEIAKTDQSIDEGIDSQMIKEVIRLDKKGDDVLVEGRVQFHICKDLNPINVYVYVDPKVAAERIFNALNNPEEAEARNEAVPKSVEDVQDKNKVREKIDAARYKKVYGVDHRDPRNYNVIIDTTNVPLEKMLNLGVQYMDMIKTMMKQLEN